MSYKQHPNAGKLRDDECRYTMILPKSAISQIKSIAYLESRSMKSVYTEALVEFLRNYWGGPKQIQCEVVGMNERSVKVATTDDHRWCLSLDVGYFGGEFPKMGERMSITMNRDEV